MTDKILKTLFIFICFFNFSCNAQKQLGYSRRIAHYVDFLREQNTSGVDYIFQLFESYDIVVICERMHPEYTQYDFFFQIVTDPRFAEIGGKIYTEIFSMAGTKMWRRLDFTEDESTVKKVIDSIAFNTFLWPFYYNRNMYNFLTRLYYFNLEQPADKRIEWMGVDDEFLNWYNIRTQEDMGRWHAMHSALRNHTMTNNIHNDFINNNRKKGLVIMNFRHSFMFPEGGWSNKGVPLGYIPSTALFLNRKPELNGRVVNVWLNTINSATRPIPNLPVANGKLDAAFRVLGNPSLGFDMESSPLGEEFFELWRRNWIRHDLSFKDIFHGFVFFNPIEEHRWYQYFPEYYSIPENREEFIRRMKLINNVTDEGRINVSFLDRQIRKEPYPQHRTAERRVNRWLRNN